MNVVSGKRGGVVAVVLHGVGGSLVPRRKAEHGPHLGLRSDGGFFARKKAAENRPE